MNKIICFFKSIFINKDINISEIIRHDDSQFMSEYGRAILDSIKSRPNDFIVAMGMVSDSCGNREMSAVIYNKRLDVSENLIKKLNAFGGGEYFEPYKGGALNTADTKMMWKVVEDILTMDNIERHNMAMLEKKALQDKLVSLYRKK